MKHPRKKPREALALRRTPPGGQGAPSVVARGRGEIAGRIIETAIEAGVPIHEDHDLLELLSFVELGDEIPEEVYGAVAQLITFLWELNEGRGDEVPGGGEAPLQGGS